MPVVGLVNSMSPGHRLNQMLVKKILSDNKNYNIDTLEIKSQSYQYIDGLSNNHFSEKETNVA